MVACLDTIEDAMKAAQDYLNKEELSAQTQGYIFIYGVLQALYVQQDAFNHLINGFNSIFGLKLKGVTGNDRIKEIREVRNDIVGHPTDRKVIPKRYTMLNRSSITKRGFQALFLQSI